VIKRVSEDGSSSFDRLRREADVLTRLAPDPCFPAPFELFEESGQLFLAMEDIEGHTIEQTISSLRERSTLPTREQVVTWGCELAKMLDVIHGKGLIYGDIKASNVLVASDGQLRLLDFELAREHDGSRSESRLHGRGTQGYMSPQQVAGYAFEIADDIYGLGAFLYLIATGAEPSQAPNPSALLDRPIELLNPALGAALAQVIGRCLDPVPAQRFASAVEVAWALSEARSVEPVSSPPFGGEHAGEPESVARERARALARLLGDTICAEAKRAPDGRISGWAGGRHFQDAYRSTDLNAGGGAVIALAELVAEFNEPAHRAALTEGVCWLAEARRPLGDPFPGLYVGEAGVGGAQLRAGQVLGDSDLVAAAAERGHWIATLPHSSPDLFNGTAGRLRFHLWLWDETTDAAQLNHAIAAGEQLLAAANVAAGEARWTMPPAYGSLSGKAWLGYAHGAAGIGDVLLDLFEVTGDRRFLKTAEGAGRWLETLARPALEDKSGLNWPIGEQGSSAMAFWCHGAAGVGRFMLHLAKLGAMPSAFEHAERAARVVGRGARWAGATQCHGHAGNSEFLLDMYQATCDRAYLYEARSLARLLNAFASEVNGLLYWITDSDPFNPGFTAGYAGVATCLLRLAHPETLPHLFSRAGFSPRVDLAARGSAA
jgi:hypothetical protein